MGQGIYITVCWCGEAWQAATLLAHARFVAADPKFQAEHLCVGGFTGSADLHTGRVKLDMHVEAGAVQITELTQLVSTDSGSA